MNKDTDKTPFAYDNLIGRPGGRYLRLGAVFLAGVRTVQLQIVPHAAAWRQHNTKAAERDDPLWVVLGDSMAQGIGASAHDKGWVGQLDTMFREHGKRYRLLNLSMSGARIEDVLERQLPALQALKPAPELVTVMVGSNDLVRKKYRVNAVANFELLLAQVPEGSVVANLLGGQDTGLAMDGCLQQAVIERGLVLADMRRHGPRNWRGLVASDHFHPNDAGYTAIARVFGRALGLL